MRSPATALGPGEEERTSSAPPACMFRKVSQSYISTFQHFYEIFSFSDKHRDEDADDAALAQLIADSTEKRFKISNILKVKWKKKHYSFDLG